MNITQNNASSTDTSSPSFSFLQALSRPFPPEHVRERKGAGGRTLLYVDIQAVQDRLDEVLGSQWELQTEALPLQIVSTNDKVMYLAQCTATITISAEGQLRSRSGVGSSIKDDPDDAVKTALSEAVKKAANQWGVGRELWSAARRGYILHLSEYENMNAQQFRSAIRKAAREWRTDKSVRKHYPTDDAAIGDFLKSAYLAEPDVDALRKRWQGLNTP